jgi:hypothetical protein
MKKIPKEPKGQEGGFTTAFAAKHALLKSSFDAFWNFLRRRFGDEASVPDFVLQQEDRGVFVSGTEHGIW